MKLRLQDDRYNVFKCCDCCSVSAILLWSPVALPAHRRTSGIAADFAVWHWSHLLYDAAQCHVLSDE